MGAEKGPRITTFSADTNAALRAWRASAVRLVLLVIAGSGLLSWGSVINNDRALTGLTPTSWVYLAVYLAFVLLAVLPRIDYRWRAWGLVALGYLNAIASFYRLGLVGSGRLYLLVMPIFATLLLGWRMGILATVLSLAVYWPIAHQASLHQFGDWRQLLLENPTNLVDRWGESGLALTTFLLAVIAMVVSYQRLVRRTLDAHQETSRALEQTAQNLQRRLHFEQLISKISTEFINRGPSEVDAGIQHALEAIGLFAGVDRSYIFQFSENQASMANTHEWCAEGIEPQSQRIQGQRTGVTPWTIGRIQRLEAVQIPRVAGLPDEARLDQEEFQAQSIQSLICVPMLYQSEAIGLIGFDSVRCERDWSEDDLALLRVVGEMIVNALLHQRAQAVEEGQRRFLELLATGGGFSDILNALVRQLEQQWPGMLGLILLLDADGRHLHIGASASLPKTYVDSIEGLEIGPQVGSCGTACYTRQRVIVEDIATDPRWESLRGLGLQYGLRACWSEPVFSESGPVVGTFAMYYRQPRAPSKAELRTIQTAAHLVGVAVEHERAEQALQQSELRFQGVFEGAPIGVSITSLDGRLVETNRALQQMFGYSPEELCNLSFPDYTYPDDIAEDTRQFAALVSGAQDHYQLEKRYLRKNGEVFWGRLSVSLARGSRGEPLFAIAITEDITAAKEAAAQLAQAYQSLEQRVGERTRELAAVNTIAAVVSGSLDLQEILGAALDKTLEVTAMELGLAYRLEATESSLLPRSGMPDPASLHPLVYRGLSEQFFPATIPLNLDASNVRQAWEAGFPVIRDPQSITNRHARQAMEAEGIQLLITIPLLVKERLVGALVIGSHQPRTVAPEELAMLSAIGQQVALAVENARLYEQVQQTALLEERSRLARELHDSVTQSLYSVTLYAEAAARLFTAGDTQTAVEHLRELRDTATEALREMRLLIYELRPPVLETGGLEGALQARLDAVETRAGLHAALQVEGTDVLPAAVQEELYHIAREALNNLLKHARARSVHVHLVFQETSTLLEICDDGVGFHPDEIRASGGLGIPGMKERAQRIGARLEIYSAPGEGTMVRVSVTSNGRG